MIEIGTVGFPFRAPAIAAGAAVAAEADGAHAVWYPDRLPAAPPPDLWRDAAGPLADVVPDPTDLADPFVTATTALLATRRLRVGVLGLDLGGGPPERLARTIATLTDVAPGRVVVALDAGPQLADRDARAAALHDALVARAVHADVVLGGDDDGVAGLAARFGWAWLATIPVSVDVLAARAASVPGTAAGMYLPIVAHEDETLARKALGGPLLAAMAAQSAPGAEHVVVGAPEDVLAALRAYADAGLRRVVLDNLLVFGIPEELDGARRATRAILRSARLAFRDKA